MRHDEEDGPHYMIPGRPNLLYPEGPMTKNGS